MSTIHSMDTVSGKQSRHERKFGVTTSHARRERPTAIQQRVRKLKPGHHTHLAQIK